MAAERLSRFISILPDEEANKVVITSLDQFNNENELLFLACNAIEFDFTKTVASILSCGKLSRNSRSQLITFLIDFLTENNQAILSDTILARLLSDDYPTTQKIILADVNLAGCSKPLLTYLTNILLVNFDETILNEWITSPQRERVLNVIENLISDCYHKHLLLTLIPIIDNLLHFNEELFYHHQFTKEHAYLFLGEHQKQESLLLTLKNNAKVCDHLASNSLYDANADVRKIYLYHLKFGKAIAALAPHFQFNTNPIAHNKKLNIGIVMEDTNLNHPVFRFIAPLLQADYNQYQLIFFDCTKKPHDETLTYLKDKNHKINAIKDRVDNIKKLNPQNGLIFLHNSNLFCQADRLSDLLGDNPFVVFRWY